MSPISPIVELPRPKITQVSVRGQVMRFCIAGSYLEDVVDKLEFNEPATLDWIESFRPGDVFYDIGASFGLYALYAGVHARCEVVAFEPEAQNFGLLEMNHYVNRDLLPRPFRSLNLAASDGARMGALYIRRYEGGLAMKVLDQPLRRLESTPFAPAHVQSVMEVSLDDLIERYSLPVPTHIKIDVDGSEAKVLAGARRTLASPALRSALVEIEDPEGKGQEIVDSLASAGLVAASHERVEKFNGLVNTVFKRKEDL